MKITDLLKKQSICLDGKADSKEQVIREMVGSDGRRREHQ